MHKYGARHILWDQRTDTTTKFNDKKKVRGMLFLLCGCSFCVLHSHCYTAVRIRSGDQNICKFSYRSIAGIAGRTMKTIALIFCHRTKPNYNIISWQKSKAMRRIQWRLWMPYFNKNNEQNRQVIVFPCLCVLDARWLYWIPPVGIACSLDAKI